MSSPWPEIHMDIIDGDLHVRVFDLLFYGYVPYKALKKDHKMPDREQHKKMTRSVEHFMRKKSGRELWTQYVTKTNYNNKYSREFPSMKAADLDKFFEPLVAIKSLIKFRCAEWPEDIDEVQQVSLLNRACDEIGERNKLEPTREWKQEQLSNQFKDRALAGSVEDEVVMWMFESKFRDPLQGIPTQEQQHAYAKIMTDSFDIGMEVARNENRPVEQWETVDVHRLVRMGWEKVQKEREEHRRRKKEQEEALKRMREEDEKMLAGGQEGLSLIEKLKRARAIRDNK